MCLLQWGLQIQYKLSSADQQHGQCRCAPRFLSACDSSLPASYAPESCVQVQCAHSLCFAHSPCCASLRCRRVAVINQHRCEHAVPLCDACSAVVQATGSCGCVVCSSVPSEHPSPVSECSRTAFLAAHLAPMPAMHHSSDAAHCDVTTQAAVGRSSIGSGYG